MKENVVRIDVCVCLQCCLLAVCPTTPTMFAQTKIVFISVTYLLLRVLFKNMRFMRIVYCCRQTLNRSARRKHVLHRFAHFLSLFCVNRHRVISILIVILHRCRQLSSSCYCWCRCSILDQHKIWNYYYFCESSVYFK